MPATQAEAGSMTAHRPPRHDAAPRDGASIAVKIEGGESPRQAACRELKEETGIEAEADGIIDTVRVKVPGDGMTYRLTVFYGRPVGGTLKAAGDSEAAKWVDLEDIDAFPMTEGGAELVWTAMHRLRTR
jgi:ADP-ribose pyrophosphatase YjhB (NUDIX family)